MFHRQRSGIQVQPILSTPESGAIVEEPVTTSPYSPSTSPEENFQPQPVAEKEAVSMSTFNNTPNQTPNDAQGENTATAQQTGPASYNPQQPNRPSMPTMGARSPYAYGQSYVNAAPDATVSTGRKLIIGEGITMSGEIEACDHLVVEGTVEASLKGASILDVSQSGMFFGAVEINEATIAGRFEGDLVVNGRLTVRATGTISGTISYKELAVEAGATIDGKINPMSVNRMTTSTEKKSQGKTTPNMKVSSDPLNELPFANNKAAAAA